MWIHEHTAETAVPRSVVWQALADIDSWTEWDTSMQQIKLAGPFEVGSTVAMTPIGQDPITSTIVEIIENTRYADETSFGGVTLRFSHTLSDLPDGGTRIVHLLEITGASADEIGPQIGPEITSDFPEAMDGLIAYAGKLTLA
ncbi:polyketide cyclase [Kribbella qitaiheensis]|uniref:Polyketide cyclase n=1 Tax=Kribbella qitaiheensis TaxID=1544730 RepID=A0A7G6X087_9ACTN|nr:SRPBCC family protein [Kribbella qitaiheensis]QNE19652.1 polyketide cyclase [Kribbella qitaiheensis]